MERGQRKGERELGREWEGGRERERERERPVGLCTAANTLPLAPSPTFTKSVYVWRGSLCRCVERREKEEEKRM